MGSCLCIFPYQQGKTVTLFLGHTMVVHSQKELCPACRKTLSRLFLCPVFYRGMVLKDPGIIFTIATGTYPEAITRFISISIGERVPYFASLYPANYKPATNHYRYYASPSRSLLVQVYLRQLLPERFAIKLPCSCEIRLPRLCHLCCKVYSLRIYPVRPHTAMLR